MTRTMWHLGKSHCVAPQMLGCLCTVHKVGRVPGASYVCSWGTADGALLHAPGVNLRAAQPFIPAKAAAALEMAVGMGLGGQEECVALHHVTPR